MVRLEGWERKYSNYLKDMRNTPFEWGVHDCILASVKGVEVITGINVYQEYLGYSDEEGANKILKENGGLEALISKHFGSGSKFVLKGKRGDLVLIKTPAKSIAIIDDSGQYAVGVCEDGWQRVHLSKAYRVWSY